MGLNAAQAHARARPGHAITGWKLDRQERKRLLDLYPPRYDVVIADHVTLSAKVGPNTPLPEETSCDIVGRADDGRGVEALVVRIAGTTDRPDGSTYHITWSLAQGRKAKESNDVIARFGWIAIDATIPIRLEPARLQ